MTSEDSLVKLYIAIGDAERHFNTIQSNYRLLASTWTLACLGGIRFVLTTQQINIGLERSLICIGIALSGALSILILWLIDIHVYQRLLSEFYNEGRVMEAAMPWLPQVRLQTRRRFKGTLTREVSVFYLLMFVFLCLVAVGFIFLSEETKKLSIGRAGCAAIVIALCAAGASWVLWNTRPGKITNKTVPEDVHPHERRVQDLKTELGAEASRASFNS